jgi:hypothetical protein
MALLSYRRHRFPPPIIQHAILQPEVLGRSCFISNPSRSNAERTRCSTKGVAKDIALSFTLPLLPAARSLNTHKPLTEQVYSGVRSRAN